MSNNPIQMSAEAILDSISDAFFAMDAGMTVTFFNHAAGNVLGRPGDEVIGLKFFCAFPEKRGGFFEENILLAIHGKAPVTFMASFGAFPHERMHEARVFPFAGGIIVRLTAATTHSQVEEELRESEERYRRIVDTAAKGILSQDVNHVTTFVNARMAEMLGYEPCEMIGRPFDFYLFEEDLADHALKMRERAEGHNGKYERRFRHKDGHDIWTIVSATALKDSADHFIGSFGMFTDITGRKRSEEALRESERFARATLDALSAHIAILDETGLIIGVNRAWSLFAEANSHGKEGLGEGANYLAVCDRVQGKDTEGAAEFAAGIRAVLRCEQDEFALEYPCHSPNEKRWFIGRVTRFPGEGPIRAVVAHVNITERRYVEEALSETQSILQAAMDQSQAGIAIADAPSGKLRYVNDAGLLIRGGTRETVVNGVGVDQYVARWHMLDLDGSPLPADAIPLTRAVLYGEKCSREFIIRRAESDDRVVWVNAAPIMDSNGQVTAGIVVFLDITERRQVEKALRESEERFRTLAENSLDYIMRYDRHCRHTYMNPAALKISGMTSADIIGKTHREAGFPDNLCALWEDMIRQVFNSVEPRQTEFEWDNAKGKVHLDWRLSPEFGSDGVVYSVLGVSRDISERKRAEAAICASEVRYRRLFESAKDGILILDAETGVVEDVNPFLMKMLGFSHEELLGKKVWELGFLRDVAASQESFLELQQQEYVRYEDLPLETASGKRIEVEFISNVYEVDHKKVIQCNIRDISERVQAETERVKLESQLRQAQKMEAVGQLAGGVAHDFNNLLQVILGFTDIISEDFGEEESLPGQALAEVRKAAERAAALTQQLLAFSRRQVIAPVNLDLNDLISDMLKMVRRVIGENIELHFKPGKGAAMVHADSGQMEQILMNLCVNARDAMPGGGTLTLETEYTELDDAYCSGHPWAAPGVYLMMSIADSGHGMDATTRARIFEPFFTTKEVGQGTGLGLATVYGIVKQHNGLIHVYSEPDQGTVFRVYLPAAEETGAQARKIARPAPRGGSETILIAEDEESVRELIALTLRSAGYTVLTANDGVEAVRVFREHTGTVKLAILDVMMPRASGRQAMDKIQALDPSIRFIFSSGYSEGSIHANFVIENGLRLIKKPYRRNELLHNVRQVLDEPA